MALPPPAGVDYVPDVEYIPNLDNEPSDVEYIPNLDNEPSDVEYLPNLENEPFQPIRDLFGIRRFGQVTPFDQVKHFIAPTAATGIIAVKFFSNLNPVLAVAITASSILVEELTCFALTPFLIQGNASFHLYTAIDQIEYLATTALQAYVMTQLLSVNIATFATYALISNLTNKSVEGLLHLAREIEEQIVARIENRRLLDLDDSNWI